MEGKPSLFLVVYKGILEYAQKMFPDLSVDQVELEKLVKNQLLGITKNLPNYFTHLEFSIEDRSIHYAVFGSNSNKLVTPTPKHREDKLNQEFENKRAKSDSEHTIIDPDYDFLINSELFKTAALSEIYVNEELSSSAERFYELASRFFAHLIKTEIDELEDPNSFILSYSSTVNTFINATIDSMFNNDLSSHEKAVVGKYVLVFIENYFEYYTKTIPAELNGEFQQEFINVYLDKLRPFYLSLWDVLQYHGLPPELAMSNKDLQNRFPLYNKLLKGTTTSQ